MSARPSISALSLVSSNLLQESVDIHRVHLDHGVYMLAEVFMRDDMLETWKHGHVPSHNYFSSLCLRNPILLCVVQDQFQAQSTPRTAFRQEGEDDEDMTPMHMIMFGAWYGGVGVQQGCPSQEGGPRLIRFESPRWRSKATQVRVCLGLQDQSALNWSPITHPDSNFDDPHMVGKLI